MLSRAKIPKGAAPRPTPRLTPTVSGCEPEDADRGDGEFLGTGDEESAHRSRDGVELDRMTLVDPTEA